MRILTSRNKVFMKREDKRLLKAFVRRNVATEVPTWIKDTGTFKDGIADNSITDVTPGAVQPAVAKVRNVPAPAQARVIDTGARAKAKPKPTGLVKANAEVKTAAAPSDPPLPPKPTVDNPAPDRPAENEELETGKE